MNFKKTLYIMVGVPGSGKSTWVKEHIKPNEKWISRDKVRFSLLKDNQTYFANEKEVIKNYFKEIREALKDETISAVYADATQTTAKARRTLIETVFPFGIDEDIEIVPVIVRPSLKTCLEQNAQRTGRELVPAAAITRMYNNFSYPQHDSFNNKYNKYINVVT